MNRIAKLARSFRYAWRGIVTVAREEQNFRVQLVATAGVFALSWYVHVSSVEIAVLVASAGAVLVALLIFLPYLT